MLKAYVIVDGGREAPAIVCVLLGNMAFVFAFEDVKLTVFHGRHKNSSVPKILNNLGTGKKYATL